jgi:hypothetical protein
VVEFVLARGRDDGGAPMSVGSCAIRAEGGISESMMEGRRACAAMRDSRRSERKFGPAGEVRSPVRPQLKRGSWINYVLLVLVQKDKTFCLQLPVPPSKIPCCHVKLS